MTLTVNARGNGLRFAVRLRPRASRSEVCGVHGDAMTARRIVEMDGGRAAEVLRLAGH